MAAGGHAGDLHQVLAGLPNGGAAGFGVGLGQQPVVGLELVLAPDVRGVAELKRIAFQPQVRRLLAPAREDDPVPARKPQLGAPVAAQVGLVPNAGGGGATAPGRAAAGGRKGAGEQAVEDDQGIAGVQRVERGVDDVGIFFKVDLGGQARAHQEGLHFGFGDRPD